MQVCQLCADNDAVWTIIYHLYLNNNTLTNGLSGNAERALKALIAVVIRPCGKHIQEVKHCDGFGRNFSNVGENAR